MVMDDLMIGALYEIRDVGPDGTGAVHCVTVQEKDPYENMVYVESYELGMRTVSPSDLREQRISREA